jgi:hypothetical protein
MHVTSVKASPDLRCAPGWRRFASGFAEHRKIAETQRKTASRTSPHHIIGRCCANPSAAVVPVGHRQPHFPHSLHPAPRPPPWEVFQRGPTQAQPPAAHDECRGDTHDIQCPHRVAAVLFFGCSPRFGTVCLPAPQANRGRRNISLSSGWRGRRHWPVRLSHAVRPYNVWRELTCHNPSWRECASRSSYSFAMTASHRTHVPRRFPSAS